MQRRQSSYTEELIAKREGWILPLWGIYTAIMLYFLMQGLPSAYAIRLQDAIDLFTEPLNSFGLPLEFYPIYIVSLEYLLVVIAVLTGLYLLLISGSNRIATVSAFFMVGWMSSWGLSYYEAQNLIPLPIMVFEISSNVIYATLLLTFPTGRLQASWLRWGIIPGFVLMLAATTYNSLTPGTPIDRGFSQTILFILTASAVGLQIVRFRSHSNAIQRQQSKWVFAGFVISYALPIFFVIMDAFTTPYLIERPYIRFIYRLFSSTFFIFVPFSLLPISMLIAITKSRLWQIDLLLNKAAVSGGVTLILLGMFGAGIAGFQAISGNTIFSTASMLIIVLLMYNPLRNQIQNLLDRRILGFRFNLDDLRRSEIPREITKAGLLSGSLIDGYEVLNVIARGGMGEVYHGVSSNQAIAIKTVLPDVAQNPIAIQRFQREVEVGKILKHPKVIQIYDSGDANGTPYLVMDYVEGHDLKRLMTSQILEIPRVLDIFADIAEALVYTHEQGLIHRDVKPENILIREDGTAILIDFGLVKYADSEKDISGKGAIGTINYMAPEQIRSGTAIDARADIYGMGVLLFEMLTGMCPFVGDAGQILYAHLEQPPPDPCNFNPNIPVHICLAILRALSKDPDDRYATMSDFMAVVLEPEYAESA